MIPLVDLKAQYLSIKPEIDRTIQAVIDESAFYKGRHVEAFEARFAKAIGTKYCISVANATDGLYLALRALDISYRHEVITTANSFIATPEAIREARAWPVFCDVDPHTFNIDVTKIESLITKRTRVILPVHLYGRAVNMRVIKEIADAHNLAVVEDCAQAVMAEWGGVKVGAIGDVGVFSFYPGKNLGAMGDAGAVVTDDIELALKIRRLANHGALVKHDHEIEGVSSRMDGLQAAVLNVKLKYINHWNEMRWVNALLYQEYLKDIEGIVLPDIPKPSNHVFHLYVIRVKDRDNIKLKLARQGIETGIHYPKALPNLKAYSYLHHKPKDFPVASHYQEEILSLPMYPELTEAQIKHVADCLKRAINE